jgi:hypothetical protein
MQTDGTDEPGYEATMKAVSDTTDGIVMGFTANHPFCVVIFTDELLNEDLAWVRSNQNHKRLEQ